MADRRHTDRRLPPGTCADCQHPQGNHLDGTGDCQEEGCLCAQFAAPRLVTPKKRSKKKPTAKQAAPRKKVRHK